MSLSQVETTLKHAPPSSTEFEEGFESGDFTGWTEADPRALIITSPVHHGAYACGSTDDTFAYLRHTISPTEPDYYLRFRGYFDSLTGTGSRVLVGFYSGVTWICEVYLYWTGAKWVLQLIDYLTGTTNGTTAIDAGWHKIEISVQMDPTDRVRVWLDDVLEIDKSVNNPIGDITDFYLYPYQTSNPKMYIDCVQGDSEGQIGGWDPEFTVPSGNFISMNVHLGCTKEISSFELVLENNDGSLNPDYPYEPFLGAEVTIKVRRGSISAATPAMIVGIIEDVEYYDSAEDFEYRDVVIVRGLCKGRGLFKRSYDGDLIDDVGVDYLNYTRTSGDAASLVAYLIDNYTSLTHSRVNSLGTQNANSGQKQVVVADGTKFAALDLVKIGDDNGWEYNQILTISTNTLNMNNNLINNYTTAASLTVHKDLIHVSDTAFTEMKFINEKVYDIIKFIADIANYGSVVGFDFRIEYDSNFAFVVRNVAYGTTESYSLSNEVQVTRYRRDVYSILSRVWVEGKADKPYPLQTDGQEYSDSLTESYNKTMGHLSKDANSGQTDLVLSAGEGASFTTGDYVWVLDDDSYGERGLIASIATDTLTLSANLTSTYTTLDFAVVFKVTSSRGWGYRPYSQWNSYAVALDNAVKHTGTYSLGCDFNVSINSVEILFAFVSGSELNLEKYPNLEFLLNPATTAPTKVVLYCFSSATPTDNDRAYISTSLDMKADQWNPLTIEGGPKNAGKWVVGSSFDWTSIKMFWLFIFYASNGTYALNIDRLFFGGGRWGASANDTVGDAAVDGYAQGDETYGRSERHLVVDSLLSDAECENKAQSILNFLNTPQVNFTAYSESVDWANNPVTAGNWIAANISRLGISGTYRIDSVDIDLNSSDMILKATFEIGDNRHRVPDFIYGLVRKANALEKSYKTGLPSR